MDRLSQLRGEAGGSGDSTLDTTSPPSEAFMSANENSSKYFSISDSTFDITSIKDESLASTSADATPTITDGDELISNLSPIGKKELDNYKIGKQIEAAKILSGGVDIFDGDENSFDGDELVIDDNMGTEDKITNQEEGAPDETLAEPEPALVEPEANAASREMEVVLQIDGNNVNAIDIGNGLYLYRKDGQDELAAIQIIDDDPQHSFKFLKVRDNAEGNLEVYEEIEIEVPKEVPSKEGKPFEKNAPYVSNVPDINKSMTNTSSIISKVQGKNKSPHTEPTASTSGSDKNTEAKETRSESKSEVNLNGKMMKFSESRKSPVVGSYTPMTFHSTPNKEGKPLTKTMVDLQLDPNRHSDNVKKTIEVHTEHIKQKSNQTDISVKEKDILETVKSVDTIPTDMLIMPEKDTKVSAKQEGEIKVPKKENENNQTEVSKYSENTEKSHVCENNVEKEENTNAKELVIEEQDSKTSNGSKHLNEGSMDFVKTGATVLENNVALIEDSNTVLLKPNKLVVPQMPISSKGDKASISSSRLNEKPAPVLPNIAEQPVDRSNLMQNIKIAVEQPSNNKNELAGCMVKTATSMIIDKNTDFEKNKMEKDKSSKIKILENITLNFPTSALTKKESATKDQVESSMKPDDDNIKIPLESFTEVSSTCANLESEEGKEESITLYSIDTNESVSLITPSTSKIRDDKIVMSDKISEVLTTISSLNNIEAENACSKNEKAVISFPLVKESAVLIEVRNEADSTCKLSEQISCPNLEVKNTAETSNIQKNIKEHDLLLLKPTPPEKATSSIPSPTVKVSDQPQPFTLSKEKSMTVHSTMIEVKPAITEIQTSFSSEIKPAGNLALPLKNQLSKASQLIPATRTNLMGKAAKSAALQNVKIVQAASKPESILQEKKIISASISSHSVLAENKYSVSLAKSTAKVTKMSSTSGDVKEISSTTSNKNIKLDSHIPVVSVANKPNLKQTISAISPEIKSISVKPINNAACQKEIKSITLDKKSTTSKSETRDVKEPIKKLNIELRPVNNNHTAAVPFGKWTDAHRQEFVNKFKEVKAPLNTNSKQIKNSNDLNRRDVLQKIDSQRAQTISNATAKSLDKLIVKSENVFSSKVVTPTVETKTLLANEPLDDEPKQGPQKVTSKPDTEKTTSSALSMSYAIDVNTVAVGKKQLAPTSQNTVSKVEFNPKDQKALDKTECSANDQTTIGKTETIKINQSEVDKTKLIPKEIIVSKKETIPENEIAVSHKEADFKDQPAIGKNKIISEDTVDKTEPAPRDQNTASCYMASLIDKTIEDMINRAAPGKSADESKQAILINSCEPNSETQKPMSRQAISKPPASDRVSLDDIEMKMNELHGIPFVERPPHELPKIPKSEIKTYSKIDKNKPLSKLSKTMNTDTPTQPKLVKELDSDEEIIEHEPVTGDLDLKMKNVPLKVTPEVKSYISVKNDSVVSDKHSPTKAAEIITETEFDKFARRNSITYENCLTVSFDHKEHQNVVETRKEKKSVLKVETKLESTNNEVKSKLPVPTKHNIQLDKCQNVGNVAGDTSIKKYQSKLHSAYQSAVTAKHQVPCPIGIIEDKPVKVVFLESNIGFVPSQLNVQGKELSPAKNPEAALSPQANNDAVESSLAEVIDENKQHDKLKTKHQRKQVLTPVEEPDLELIQPSDIGIETSTKKKRKVEEIKSKSLVPKKSYLLGRNNTEDKLPSNQSVKTYTKDDLNQIESVPGHTNTVSAIDNLVKAAELLDNQAEADIKNITPNFSTQTNAPVKRGRGRPRKYPLPDGKVDDKSPSPQKKPRLIDAKPIKQDFIPDEQDDDSSEEGIVRENWTMGKINENIVCPICYKLFRSENVVFKHVKHCTGVSPNRSESDKKSPRGSRLSQESEEMDIDYDMSSSETMKETPKKRRPKESPKFVGTLDKTKFDSDKEEVIVIEDTIIKEKSEKNGKEKEEESKKEPKILSSHQNKSFVCEFCGKTFRQQSYLTNHKLQHKKDLAKKKEKDTQDSDKLQIFSCEVCKKEFRKLHHLVQHRINHNSDTVPKRTLRKSLSEQNETKNLKDIAVKQPEDTSAGFRCEPCDKSFRKLHHLVEHRGTHDGINRQKPSAAVLSTVEKPPQCEICKKTFRKLHHLIEHREQHTDTNSDKSDEKSTKSGLSTKDIIHECSLCYMVFPNEHSLNKHSVVCSKKKRQSKQLKETSENDDSKNDENSENTRDKIESANGPTIVATEIIDDVNETQDTEEVEKTIEVGKIDNVEQPDVAEEKQIEDEEATFHEVTDKALVKEEAKSSELPSAPTKRDLPKSNFNLETETPVVPEKIKKIDLKEVKAQDMPKKKTVPKNKDAPQVTKRQKSLDTPLLDVEKIKPSIECSDDDEIRYMLNPNFKFDMLNEGKTFMKVRATKRNSLQIERPNSNNHAKRRTSLQLPPKTSRLKSKAIETKRKTSEPKPKQLNISAKHKMNENKNSPKSKHVPKLSEAETLLSTDSDDSDVKYSFPKTTTEKSYPTGPQTTKAIAGNSKNDEKTVTTKSLAGKRKSLSGIAKRISLGKSITVKHKDPTPPPKQIKRRSLGVEHRCDCGELFSSAALLARHTSLAHTPPRIRRRRDPPAPHAQDKLKPIRKSSAKSEPAPSANKPTRKSSVKKTDPTPTPPADSRKSLKSTQPEAKITPKTRRSAAHSGVPVPEKMRKMIQKNTK